MSKAPEPAPFHQIPTWNASEMFEIRGDELEALYNYFNIVSPALSAVQQIFARGFQSGKIQFSYQRPDGSPVDSEEVRAYTEKINEYFKSQKRDEDTPKILSADGEPITPENGLTAV